MSNKVKVSMTLDADLLERLDELVESGEGSRSEIAEKLLWRSLDIERPDRSGWVEAFRFTGPYRKAVRVLHATEPEEFVGEVELIMRCAADEYDDWMQEDYR